MGFDDSEQLIEVESDDELHQLENKLKENGWTQIDADEELQNSLYVIEGLHSCWVKAT